MQSETKKGKRNPATRRPTGSGGALCGWGQCHAQASNSDRELSASSSPPSGRARPGNPRGPIAARGAPIAIRFSHPRPRAPPPGSPSPPTCDGSGHRMPRDTTVDACQPDTPRPVLRPPPGKREPIHSRAPTLSSSLLASPVFRGNHKATLRSAHREEEVLGAAAPL
jgi:hypothetical protein